jgi:hypothetical protein
MNRSFFVVFSLGISLCGTTISIADETLVRSLDLPGASMEQEVTYAPSKAEYERVRDDTLARLQAGDKTAMVNPSNGPWMRVETTAKIGFEIKGVGMAEGRKHLRQISAAEEALFRYQEQKK